MVFSIIDVDEDFIRSMDYYRVKPEGHKLVSASSVSPVYFSEHMIGMRPYSWQVYAMELFRRATMERALYLELDISHCGDDYSDGFIKLTVDSKEFVIITSRQIGKSIFIALISLWVVLFNKLPSSVFKNSSVLIVSASDVQSRSLLSTMKNLLRMGNIKMSSYEKPDGSSAFGKNYFSDLLSKEDANNTSTITFDAYDKDKHGEYLLRGSLQGSNVKSYPPTASVLGLCLHEDSVVHMSDGSFKSAKDVIPGDSIVSSDHFNAVPSIVHDAFDNGFRDIVSIETMRGKLLRVTNNHPVMTSRGWVPAIELSKNDRIAGLVNPLDDLHYDEPYSSDESKFIGYMLGDGSCVQRTNIKFTQESGKQKDEFTSLCSRLGFSVSWSFDKRSKDTFNAAVGVDAWPLLQRSGLASKTSHTKELPSDVHKMGLRNLGFLISRYYSCDGWVSFTPHKNKSSFRIDLSVCSVSRSLLVILQQQLLRFGIRSNIRSRVQSGGFRKTPGVIYELSIRSKRGAKDFISKIGIFAKTDDFDISSFSGVLQDTKDLIGDFEWEKIRSISHGDKAPTIGLSVSKTECHVTDGLLSHNTASALFIDEAGKYDKISDEFVDDFFYPIGNSTNAIRGYTSTPWQPVGFFYRMVDPDGVFQTEDNYIVIAFTIDAIALENPKYYETVMKTVNSKLGEGKKDEVSRGYYCRFVKGESTYFDPLKIPGIFNPELSMLLSYGGQCDMGIDIGGTVNSHTVITISMMDGAGMVHRLYHHKYDIQDDLSLLDDIANLKIAFNVQRIIIDDAPSSDLLIRKMEQERHWDIQRFNFRSEKVKRYTGFRDKFLRGLLSSYVDEDLKIEMQGLEHSKGSRQSVIQHAPGYSDDLIDSWVISSYFFIDIEEVITPFHEWTPPVIEDSKKDEDKIVDRALDRMRARSGGGRLGW